MEKPASIDDQFLTLINKIIETNIGNEHFSVGELARSAGLSRSMLHRKIKRLTNKSAGDFITEIRITRAKELLEHNIATTSEISYQVGFTDPSYFTKVFKKHFNLLPSDIRKSAVSDKHPPGRYSIETASGPAGSKTISSLRRSLIILLIIVTGGGGIYYLFNTGRSNEKSIAVLPLQNLTGEPGKDYFVDGMHDVLIGELGKIESLRVISRTSTLRYRNSDMLLKDIARDLGVNTIVEGSVMGAGDSLKLLIQVIDVFPEEGHLLVNEYYDDMQNIINIERTAIKDIAQNINIRLSGEEIQLLARSRTVNPEIYKDYLRGIYYLNQGTTESFEMGINYMRQAIERDPGDPLAYAGLALGYAIKGHGMVAPPGSFKSAAAAAEKALRIDPTLAEAHTALALIYSYHLWDWPKVKDAFEQALAFNPNSAIAHAHYAFYYVHFNEREKALYHANMAITLEPFSASYHAWLAWLCFYYGDYDQAEILATKALELQEGIPYGNLVLGWIHIKRGQYHKAIELHSELPTYGDYYKMLIGYTYIQSGEREKALLLWNEMETASEKRFVNPFHRGMLASMLGYTDRAFELFNEACDHKYYPITYIDIFPGIEELKDDPRYGKLMQKMKFPYSKPLLTENRPLRE